MNEKLAEALLAAVPHMIGLWRAEAPVIAKKYERRFARLIQNQDRCDSPWCNTWRALGPLAEKAASDQVRSTIRECLLDVPEQSTLHLLLLAELPTPREPGNLLDACAKPIFKAAHHWYSKRFAERLARLLAVEPERLAIEAAHWMLLESDVRSYSWQLSVAIARTWAPRRYLQLAKEWGDTNKVEIVKCLRIVYQLGLREALQIFEQEFP